MVASCRENSIQRGTEADEIIFQPVGYVNKLKKAGLLPRSARVVRESYPGKAYMKRCVLYGVTSADLLKRAEAIQDYIDFENPHASVLDGRQTITHLTEMIMHAAITAPHEYADDAMAQGLFMFMSDPVIFKALTQGAGESFGNWAHLFKAAA